MDRGLDVVTSLAQASTERWIVAVESLIDQVALRCRMMVSDRRCVAHAELTDRMLGKHTFTEAQSMLCVVAAMGCATSCMVGCLGVYLASCGALVHERRASVDGAGPACHVVSTCPGLGVRGAWADVHGSRTARSHCHTAQPGVWQAARHGGWVRLPCPCTRWGVGLGGWGVDLLTHRLPLVRHLHPLGAGEGVGVPGVVVST